MTAQLSAAIRRHVEGMRTDVRTVVRVHPADEDRVHEESLRYGLYVVIRPDPNVPRGCWKIVGGGEGEGR